MNAFDPLETTKRLEAAELERPHAEAIATEIWLGKMTHATRSRLSPATERRINRNAAYFAMWLIFLIMVASLILHAIATR